MDLQKVIARRRRKALPVDSIISGRFSAFRRPNDAIGLTISGS